MKLFIHFIHFVRSVFHVRGLLCFVFMIYPAILVIWHRSVCKRVMWMFSNKREKKNRNWRQTNVRTNRPGRFSWSAYEKMACKCCMSSRHNMQCILGRCVSGTKNWESLHFHRQFALWKLLWLPTLLRSLLVHSPSTTPPPHPRVYEPFKVVKNSESNKNYIATKLNSCSLSLTLQLIL